MSFFNVAPRYTAGSPACVRFEIAELVAKEERRFYAYCLSGVFGETYRATAEAKGLSGIVTKSVEKRGNVYTVDLLTGQAWEMRGIYNQRGPVRHEMPSRPDLIIGMGLEQEIIARSPALTEAIEKRKAEVQ